MKRRDTCTWEIAPDFIVCTVCRREAVIACVQPGCGEGRCNDHLPDGVRIAVRRGLKTVVMARAS